MKIEVRRATYEDLREIQIVAEKSWHATYEGIIPKHIRQEFLRRFYSEEMMIRRLNHSLLLVAVLEQQIVGFANFSHKNKMGVAELAAIYLLPNVQGRGIGTALLSKGIEELNGFEKIYINVEKENQVGVHFYLAKGFTIECEFDDEFDGHILKTIRMFLPVSKVK